MTVRLRHPFALATIVLALASATARAAEPADAPEWGQDRGFSLGAQFMVDGLGVSEAGTPISPVIDDMGSGLLLLGGYSFTPHFHTRVTLGGARHRTEVPGLDVQHSVGSVEAHYRFTPRRQVCPYVFGSLGGTTVRAEQGRDHLTFTGATAGLGAGLLVGFTPRFGMDLTLRGEGVNWTKAEYSQDQPNGTTVKVEDAVEETGASTRLEIGFLWQF